MADNISVFEEYLFAQDKSQFIESCKNASEIKKYIRLCHLLSQPGVELEQHDRDLLESWKRNYNYGDKRALVMKDQLNAIVKEENATKRQQLMVEFNQKYLGFSFNDYRQTAGNQAQTHQEDGEAIHLKTALTKEDHEEMLTSTKLNEAINSESGNLSFNLNELGLSILSTIDFGAVKSWRVKETLFGYLPRYTSCEVQSDYLEHRANPCGLQGISEI